MSEAIILPQFIPPTPDLSNYALKAHNHSEYASSSHSHSGYASIYHSHSEYATTSWVTANFAPKGSGGTDPTPPSTGGAKTITIPSGAVGPLSFNRVSSTTDWPVYTGTLYEYAVPSIISSLRISWTGVSGTISGDRYTSYDYNTEESHTDGSMLYLYLFSTNSGQHSTNVNAFYGTAVGEITKLASLGYNAGQYSTSFAAGSYNFPSSTLANYAGKTLYVGYNLVCTNAIYGVTYQRNITITTSNPCQITFTPS